MRVRYWLLAIFWCASAAGAEEKLPILTSTIPVVIIREGDVLRKDYWTLSPETKPDVFEAWVPETGSIIVTFITDVDSLSFTVKAGDQHDFIIQHGKDQCFTRITGMAVIPMAVFDARYRSAHRGKISVEVPEAYELVNIAIAMTPTGLADSNLVYHNSDYYADMRRQFDPYQGHPALEIASSVPSVTAISGSIPPRAPITTLEYRLSTNT